MIELEPQNSKIKQTNLVIIRIEHMRLIVQPIWLTSLVLSVYTPSPRRKPELKSRGGPAPTYSV